MTNLRKFNFKNLLFPLIIIILCLPAIIPLIQPGYFSMHDDIQIMRVFEMQKCFQDLQLPCRWAPDMGAAYGHPLFNFHPVLPYYFGIFLRVTNLSIVDSVKALFAIGLIGSGIFMYFLTKEFLGKFAGLIAAMAIVYAPYRSVQTYVRGSLNESWALMFVPLIFLAVYKFIQNKKWYWFVLSVLSLTGLMLSHNLMIVIFFPLIFLWGVYWIVWQKKYRLFFRLGVLFIWAIGLASFYIIPSYFERDLARIDFMTTGYYSYIDHFVDFNQLFISNKFGYGPSINGFDDDLSFQIGWPFVLLSAISLVVLIIQFLQKKTKSIEFKVGAFFIFLFLFGVFMSLTVSKFLWDQISFLKFLQFPWRYLTVINFDVAFLSGWLVFQILQLVIPKSASWRIDASRKSLITQLVVTGVFMVSIIGLNFNYFHPQIYYPNMNDYEALVNLRNYRLQSLATLQDYVPVTVKQVPSELAPRYPWVENKQVILKDFNNRTNHWNLIVENETKTPQVVFMPVFDFPNWEVYLDGKKINHLHDHPLGVISYAVPPGEHSITAKFTDTSTRRLANTISLISVLLLLIFIGRNVIKSRN